MKDPLKEVIPAIYDKLVLANIKYDGKAVPIYTIVPDDVEKFPYIKIEGSRGEDYGVKDSNVWDMNVDVTVVTKFSKRGSLTQVDSIVNDCSQAIQEASLSLDSFTVCMMRVMEMEPREELDELGRVLFRPLRCRVITEEN